MGAHDWTDEENDAIVANYFAMLADELSRRSYNKAKHNRALQQRIGRGRGSIECKHQNISAVLKGLGEDWIQGYKPAFNIQESLKYAVARWLKRNQDWLVSILDAGQKIPRPGLREHAELYIGQPPTFSNSLPPEELDQMMAIAAQFDVAGRHERNRMLGRAGEERVLAHERAVLRSEGRKDLAKQVRWVSDLDGDGAGYDIASFYADGSPRLVEVKTTNGWERTPFHISRNELDVAQERRDEWHLVRLYHFAREPKAFEIRPPLEAHVALTPTSFLASFEQAFVS